MKANEENLQHKKEYKEKKNGKEDNFHKFSTEMKLMKIKTEKEIKMMEEY